VPDAHVHEPWSWNGANDLVGKLYPKRIIDLRATTALAKERIYGSRRSADFREVANTIQDKHGSRKSGMPMTGQKRRSKPKFATPSNQIEFDL
jgi:deoxyribodipyrimidine photo-lyase